MPGVSREQIASAKQIDLLSYLQVYEPGVIFKSDPNEYRLKEHDSFVISNGLWRWCSRGISGKTALDYLIHVRGLKFVDAVNTLLDGRTAPILPSQPVYPKIKKPFALPKANRCGFHAVEYLQKRGIDNDIITRCIKENRFYESVHYHNCVFVGYDIAISVNSCLVSSVYSIAY